MRTALDDGALGSGDRGASISGRVAVVGFARTGRAVASLLKARAVFCAISPAKSLPSAMSAIISREPSAASRCA